MADRRSIDALKELGSGKPAPEGIVTLYRRAFAEFGAESLWNRKPSAAPTIAQALVIAETLRREGNMRSRPLAGEIEQACRAASALNWDGPRISGDIDIFHDREEAVAQASSVDTALLTEYGCAIQWLRREPGIHGAVVRRHGESTRLDWARDSDFRFFPAMKDDLFGYRLHVADLATNKALAAAGRREPRDVLDLIYIHDRHLPLAAVIWAAVGKDPGYSPESLIGEIRRNARYRDDDYADLDLIEPVKAGEVARQLRAALEEAEAFVQAMPDGKEGLLFLKDGVPVQPDPENLGAYVEHAGRRRGYWPSSAEISSAMLEGKGKPVP